MNAYTLPDLPYKTSDLEPRITADALELHHGKHHAAYVDGANKALDDMARARESGDYSALNQLQKNLAFHLSGHILHSIFWRVMSPNGGGDPDGLLRGEIEKSFGDIDAMRDQLTQCALSIQGSGWASLAWEPLSQRLLVEQVHDHQGNIGNATVPILVLDMWEHAYYLQYRNEKAKWVQAFWEVVNWADAENRLQGVSGTNLMLTDEYSDAA
jgi:Fe-Mn family superoxide dismutase